MRLGVFGRETGWYFTLCDCALSINRIESQPPSISPPHSQHLGCESQYPSTHSYPASACAYHNPLPCLACATANNTTRLRLSANHQMATPVRRVLFIYLASLSDVTLRLRLCAVAWPCCSFFEHPGGDMAQSFGSWRSIWAAFHA